MEQQFYAVVFSGEQFGTMLIGDVKDVQRITRDYSNMHPVLAAEGEARALVLSMHTDETDAARVALSMKLKFIALDKFDKCGPILNTTDRDLSVTCLRSVGTQANTVGMQQRFNPAVPLHVAGSCKKSISSGTSNTPPSTEVRGVRGLKRSRDSAFKQVKQSVSTASTASAACKSPDKFASSSSSDVD